MKMVGTIAPEDYFGGEDASRARYWISEFEKIGVEVFALDTSCFFPLDDEKARAALEEARRFAPDFAISLPNAGYASACRLPGKSGTENIFTESLAVPLALLWDDPLGQFSAAFLPYAATPDESTSGALKRIREGINDPFIFHFAWDSGHVRTMEALGLLEAKNVFHRLLPAASPYIEEGLVDRPHRYLHDVLFAGNVYLDRMAKNPLNEFPVVRDLARSAADKKITKIARPLWNSFMEAIDELSEEERRAHRLDPDESFFWTVYRFVAWEVAPTLVRMNLLKSIRREVAFYGCFVDPESVNRFSDYPNVKFCGSVDYIEELPQLFRSAKITVDVVNPLSHCSVPTKFYECFAAGGFMLIDYKPDLVAAFGKEAVEAISYRSSGELNEKIDYFLERDNERQELTRHFQEIIRREHTSSAWVQFIASRMQVAASSLRCHPRRQRVPNLDDSAQEIKRSQETPVAEPSISEAAPESRADRAEKPLKKSIGVRIRRLPSAVRKEVKRFLKRVWK